MSKEPERPILLERADYRPAYRHEEFIVPLLNDAILAALADHCAVHTTGEKVLDVGCGRQPFRTRLEAMGYKYTSIDTQQSPEQNVEFIGAIDVDLPAGLLEFGPFKLIFCTEVLEHVADWDRAFANFSALLAPGGRLLITCPHVYPLHEVPYDFWRPTAYALEYFAKRIGLGTVEKRQLGDGWDVIGTALGIAQPKAARQAIFPQMMCRAVSGARWGLWLILKTRVLQRLVTFGPMYISNLVVFER